MADWFWIVASATGGFAAFYTLVFVVAQVYYRTKYLNQIVRIFEEKPLFIIPKGKPSPAAEDVVFPTEKNGLTLRGCYLNARLPRKGVILFGLEFGSNRWAAAQYCSALLDAGYDVFAYEPRNQGESDKDPTYDPLQWVTDRDCADARAAVAYLKGRPDAPSEGIGLLGISKGGSTGVVLASEDPWVRCVVTDGAYAVATTMVPYMRRWVHIYVKRMKAIRNAVVPNFFYRLLGQAAIRESERRRGVRFVNVEGAIRRYRRPLLMIHGGADAYIKPEMARKLCDHAGSRDKELWLIPGAKHNQGLHTAGEEYHRRIVEFFDKHLGAKDPASAVHMPPPDHPTPLETEKVEGLTGVQSR